MTKITKEQEELLGSVENLPLIYYPNSLLNDECYPIEDDEFNDELETTIKNMFYTMKMNNGIGLAAPQIGLLQRIIVINVTRPMVLINPIIATYGKETTINEEGCLSFPDYYRNVKRYKKISVVYQDNTGEHLRLTATDLTSVVIQHEIDHINGKLFVDELSILKRMFIKRKITKNLKHRESL